MGRGAHAIFGIAGSVSAALYCVSATRAETAREFYGGKVIRLVVGGAAGGGYDTYARLFAPYLEERLGAQVLVQNRPGGAQTAAMNYVYSIAAPDGLTIMLATGEGAVLGSLLGEPGYRFDMTKFPVLGRLNSAPRIFIVNPQTPYRTLKDLVAAQKPIVLGYTGMTDGGSDTGAVFCHALKLPCKPVIGYKSSQDFTLAAVRGEVDGTVLSEDSVVRYMQSGQLRTIVVTGGEKSELAPQVPTVYEAVEVDAEAKWWLDFRDDLRRLGRVILATPGTPKDRIDFLANGVREVATDPKTMEIFAKRGIPLRYETPEKISEIVARFLGGSLSDAKVAEIKHVITQKYYQ